MSDAAAAFRGQAGGPAGTFPVAIPPASLLSLAGP
jgi:hypothetical protein